MARQLRKAVGDEAGRGGTHRGSGSQSLACQPARAKTFAQARPMSPEPTMATTGIGRSLVDDLRAGQSQSIRRLSSRLSLNARDGPTCVTCAALERDGAVRQRERQVEVVVDDDDRDLVAQLVEGLEQFLDHRRRQALEGLVEQQHLRVAGERPRHRDHLLLAARKVVGRRAPALLDARKEGEDPLLVPVHARAVAPAQPAELHVLGDAHAGEEPAALRHVRDAAPRDPRRA